MNHTSNKDFLVPLLVQVPLWAESPLTEAHSVSAGLTSYPNERRYRDLSCREGLSFVRDYYVAVSGLHCCTMPARFYRLSACWGSVPDWTQLVET